MFLTIAEAATAMGKSPRMIRYMIEANKLPAIRKGKAWMLRMEDLPLTEAQRRQAAQEQAKLRDVIERVLLPAAGIPDPLPGDERSEPSPKTPPPSPALGASVPERGRSRSVLKLEVCQKALHLLHQLPGAPYHPDAMNNPFEPARVALQEGIRALCRFTCEYDSRRKLDALQQARLSFSLTLAELVLKLPPDAVSSCGGGSHEPEAASSHLGKSVRMWMSTLEDSLVPSLGALFRQVEKSR